MNHTRQDIKDNLTTNSLFYFQKEFLLILTKKLLYKISISTSAV